MAHRTQPIIGDQFGQPVPPNLSRLFGAAKYAPSVLRELAKLPLSKVAREAIQLIRNMAPAAICPHCRGFGCMVCCRSGCLSIAQFDHAEASTRELCKRYYDPR